MGQLIAVGPVVIGDVAVFALDRSLTGQDASVFRDAPSGGTPPEILAQRLWADDPEVTSVHVLSNAVTVARNNGWPDDRLGATAEIIASLFIHYDVTPDGDAHEVLRREYYNATITSIRIHNPELWVIRIDPDEPVEPFAAGQYTTLGLGYWEPRADDAIEDFSDTPEKEDKVARRSYSVSSSILDDDGGLVDPNPPQVEFYIVKVPPHLEEIPALTPRLFKKTVGDRLYMGHKFAGRYTLDGVEADDSVVFLSTGTGEAPHNKMTAELLRNGHEGRILSVCCVRYRRDLAYEAQHADVEARYPTYRYVALTTREPENEGQKVYIQDYLISGRLESDLEATLDPARTHVFLCGNPLMIGLPTWDEGGDPQFPETLGVCQLLHERGFTIDHGRERGNVHYEEFWKER
jgi:ferredoxin--NADP+ reductase